MRKNKVFSIILLVAMVFSLYTPSALAEEAVADFKVESLEFCDSLGNPVTTLVPNSTITVEATVKKNVEGAASATLMFAAYNDGTLINLSSDKKDYAAEDRRKNFTVDILLPADVSDVSVMTFLWDDILDMNVLTSPAVFKSDNTDIVSLKVGGITAPAFDENNETTVTVYASSGDEPRVEAVCADLTTTVTPSYEDGVITLTATSAAGTTETYKVNYAKADPVITNIVYNQGGIDYPLTTNGTVKVLDYESLDQTKSYADLFEISSLIELADYVTGLDSERFPYWHYTDIPERFIGLNYIATPNCSRFNANGTMTFTTNKSVRLYYSTKPAHLDQGATSIGTYSFSSVKPGDSASLTTPLVTMLAGKATFDSTMYTMDVIVPEGTESVTQTVKVSGLIDWNYPKFFYEFIEDNTIEIVPALTNISNVRDGNTWTFTQTGVVRQIPEITDRTQTYATLLGTTNLGEIPNYASPAVLDRKAWIYTSIPQKFVGMNYVPWLYDPHGQASVWPGDDTITFTTNKSVEIYYSATSGWHDEDAIFDGDYQFQFVTNGDSGFTTNTIESLTSQEKNIYSPIYKKTITVAEGETETVSVKLRATPSDVGGAWSFPIFMYKFVD